MSTEEKAGDKYYLGLDVGTNSTGYALTDDKYNIVKKGKRQAIGTYLMPGEVTGAMGRRLKRGARRRYERRAFRISLLQELFAEEMAKKDENFFYKLRENDLIKDDRKFGSKYSLFNDPGYTDKEFYREYKTIYHLRKDLIENGTDDIRKLYLALHHIIKYRGNFLIEGDIKASNIQDSDALSTLLKNYNDAAANRNQILEENEDLEAIHREMTCLDATKADTLNKIFISNEITGANNEKINTRKIADKINETLKLFDIKDKKSAVINSVFGYKFTLSNIFGKNSYDDKNDDNKENSYTFKEKFEEQIDKLSALLSEYDYAIIDALKRLYDYRVMASLLKGSSSVSDAMIHKYDKHRKDLKRFKSFIKKFAPEKYEKVFGFDKNKNTVEEAESKNNASDKKNKDTYNYTMYIGGGRPLGKDKIYNGRLGKTCSRSEFYKFVSNLLANINDEAAASEKAWIIGEIESDNFLPKIVSTDNGVLPYQLNENELRAILRKAEDSGNFEWLKTADKYGTVSDKIISILTHRREYYIGTVKEYRTDAEKPKNNWVVRKESGRITPWNIADKIDYEETSEEFIKRMLNHCPYLGKTKSVLPKNSIIYSKYLVLSELNNLKLNEEPLSVESKNTIFDELYLGKDCNPSIKKIEKLIAERNGVKTSEVKLTGYGEKLWHSLKSYHALKRVIGDKADNSEIAERLIVLMTVHNEPSGLKRALKKEFKGMLTDEEIDRLKGYKYSGWGKFSREFIDGRNCGGLVLTDALGERHSILELMRETGEGLQQIIFNMAYDFESALKELRAEYGEDDSAGVSYKDIEEAYLSPSAKKSAWQTFKLVETLISEVKRVPDKIFIEVAREKSERDAKTGKGAEKKSRYEQLLAIYKEAVKKFKKESNEYINSLKESREILAQENDPHILDSEKLYLYYMQLGRCAYSNKAIPLNELNYCDIDHIYPQSKVKDDSVLNNKVLVYKQYNADKRDNSVIAPKCREDGMPLWKFLHEAKLMTDEKYGRLTRRSELTQAEIDDFNNKQLVETSQTALLVRDLLKRQYPESEIVLSKACNVSSFRKKYNIPKIRDISDEHHAIDAYLNVVVGNVLNESFSKGNSSELRSELMSEYNMDNGETEEKKLPKDRDIFMKVFDKALYANYTNRCIWNPKYSLRNVKENIEYAKVNFVTESKKNTGQLFDETINKACRYKAKNKNLKPYTLRETGPKSNPERYGYKKSSPISYFIVVDSAKKGKVKRSIEPISIIDGRRIEAGKLTHEELFDSRKLKNARPAAIKGMREPILKTGTLLDIDGSLLILTGTTDYDKKLTLNNANQLKLPKANGRQLSGEMDNRQFVNYIKELYIIKGKAIRDKKKDIDEKEFMRLENEKRRRLESPDVKNKGRILLITKSRNEQVYEFIKEKLNTKPYNAIPGYSNLIACINGSKEIFTAYPEYKQADILIELLNAFHCSSHTIDTRPLKGSKHMASIKRNNDITDSDVKAIFRSKTGLKERIVVLNELT